MSKAFAALALILVAAGCAVGPDYKRPVIDLPESWPAPVEGALKAPAAGERWWSLYGDPVLERVVEQTLAANADLQVAVARVLEARALAGIADADLYPVVSAQAARSRTQNSLVGSAPLPADFPRTRNNNRVSLDASYEVDLWGRYRRSSEAARAQLLAAESARDAARQSLVATTAQRYFALLAADAQEATVQQVLAGRSANLTVLRERLDAGRSSELDLRQAEAEEAAARSQLAAAVQAREREEAALAVLLGRAPREVLAGRAERGVPAELKALWVPEGLPSDLLLRRPDLHEAEQRLVAANARIGAARTQFFPSISLTASLGSESTKLADLFSGPAGTFGFAAGLLQPIFNAGRLGYQVEAEEARRDQALAQYRQAVANAFADVRTALAAQTAARDTLDAESARAQALRLALEKANQRFDAGVASRLELLDAERQLLQADLARIDAERAQRAAVADLFKALGGGW